MKGRGLLEEGGHLQPMTAGAKEAKVRNAPLRRRIRKKGE